MTANSRVLVTRRLPSKVVARLEERHDVDRHDGESLPAEELRTRVRDKQAIVCVLTDRIDAAAIDAAPELKIVANVAVGYDNVDVAYAKRRGVIVTNTPDVLTNAVAEYTWGLILDDRAARDGRGPADPTGRLEGVRVRLHARHRAPRQATRHSGDGPHRPRGGGARAGVRHVGRLSSGTVSQETREETRLEPRATSFDELLVTSDVISIHTPLTPDTRHLIDQRALARMKRSAYLINTSRGPVVDEEALAWGLRERLIAGAALDVFEREPDVHANLLDLDNVVLAPHLGSATTRNANRHGGSRRQQRARGPRRRVSLSRPSSCMAVKVPVLASRRRPSKRAPVATVMRRLAKAIDGLDEPAVEKIAESRQDDPFQVLIATMLSAQTQGCRDRSSVARLFRVARTPRTMARLDDKEIERLIYPVSFYRNKART